MVIGDDQESFFQIGTQIPLLEKEWLVDLLKRNVDLFAWDAYKALGLDPKFFYHHLNVNPSITPKRQPPQRPSKSEVTKLKQARAIKEVFYPQWLANTVVVKKKTGKWRVCVDFTDLNRACPKNPFPYTSDRPIGRCDGRPSSDELFGCLSRISLDTPGIR